MIRKLWGLFVSRDDEGQGLVEYGLIMLLISVVAIAALGTTGANANSLIQSVATSLSTVS
jgi:pilus assembly protein Flp/PilA